MWRARIKKSFFPSPEGGENCVAEKRGPGFACQKGEIPLLIPRLQSELKNAVARSLVKNIV